MGFYAVGQIVEKVYPGDFLHAVDGDGQCLQGGLFVAVVEEEGDAWYLRPGDVVHQPELRQPGNHYLVYNDKFIKISDSCPAKPPSAD